MSCTTIQVRTATQEDIRDIKRLLSFYYLDTEDIEDNLAECRVAVLDKRVVGCACLYFGDIVELRSIAVLPGMRNRGIGTELIRSVMNRAAELTGAVYLLTSSPAFFEKNGFKRLESEEKRIILEECAGCDKFDVCRQILMKFDIKPDS